MILDLETRLSSAQALTASGATTDYYDCGGAFNLDKGEPVAMVYTVTTAADITTGDETYALAVQTDSDSAFGTVQTLLSRTIAAADLAVGDQHVFVLPNGCLRYIRGYATLGGTTPSVSFDCDILPLSMARQDASVYYASGYSIS